MHKKRIIFAIFIIILAIILAIILIPKKPNLKENPQIAIINPLQYTINVGTTTVNIEKAFSKTNEDINVPMLGAGMIPIKKADDGDWVVVDKTDTTWYDYFNSKPAYMCLSNKNYSSEYETGKITASPGLKITESEIGVVYVWIPRFAYTNNSIGFLKDTRTVKVQEWTTSDLFTIKMDKEANNIEVTGIWLEKTAQDNSTQTQNKVNSMNSQTNEYGIIANEKVYKIDEKCKIQLDKYNSIYNLRANVDNYDNLNRTCIKVVDSEKRTELIVRAAVLGKTAKVTLKKNIYEIDKVVYQNTGEILDGLEKQLSVPAGFHTFIVIDKAGNVLTCGDRKRRESTRFNRI